MFKRFLKYLTSSWSSTVCLVVFIIGALVLCGIGVRSCAPESLPSAEESENLDAAGLEASANPATNNSINITQLPDSSFIYDISIEELANADSYLDGQTVQVVGEVVGDRIFAAEPDYCWITLQSIENSDLELSVYMPLKAAETIDTYGAYGKRGTQLQVRGTFNLACRDHFGASELHAENVSVVTKGEVEHVPLEPRRLVPGIVLIMAGCALMLLYNVLRERQR